jgi:hypothetical protein
MKEMCFCGECMGRLMLGTGFHLEATEKGYRFFTDYPVDEKDMDFYLKLIKSTVQSGFEVGQNRWINGYDAYNNVDRAVLSRAGIDPWNEDIEENALAGLFAIARSSFIAGLTSNI